MWTRKRRAALTAVAVSALGVLGLTVASADTPVTQVKYYACMKAGLLYNVGTSAKSCTLGGTLISWNQVGPAGPAGAQGPRGQAGPAGADGAPGAAASVQSLPVGDENCPTGGARLTGGDGTVAYICNGSDGEQGDQGPQGEPGSAGADGAGLVSFDQVSGLPCREGTPHEGTIQVTYAADDTATVRCATGHMALPRLNQGLIEDWTTVSVRGVVTAVSPTRPTLWMQDEQATSFAGMRVNASGPDPISGVRIGDTIAVTGTYRIVGPAVLDFRHDEIDEAAITVVDDTTEPPAPVRVTPEQSLEELVPYDGVLVRLDGLVNVAGPSGNSWLITGWSGVAAIGTLAYDGPPVATGMRFASVTGPLQSKADADVMAIQPRSATDLPAAP